MVPIHGEKNDVGVTLGGNNTGKLKYLDFSLTPSKSSSKVIYVSWILFFVEEEGSPSGVVVEALPSYWLTCLYCRVDRKMVWIATFFPLAILLAKGKRLALTPVYLRSLIIRPDECLNNVVRSLGR